MDPMQARRIPSFWWFVAVCAAIFANSSSELFKLSNASLFIAAAISAFVVYKVTRWADAYEHESQESLIWTAVFGFGISGIVTLALYGAIPDYLES